MRYVWLLLLVIVSQSLLAQNTDPSGVDADALRVAGVEMEQFATQQNRASVLYVLGIIANVASIPLYASQPQVAVGMSVIGGVLGLSGWIVDRSSFQHLETAGRLVQRSLISLPKDVTNGRVEDTSSINQTLQRDSVIAITRKRDEELESIITKYGLTWSRFSSDCESDALPGYFCTAFGAIHKQLTKSLNDARLGAVSKTVIENQVFSIEKEVNTYADDVMLDVKARNIARSYKEVIDEFKGLLE